MEKFKEKWNRQTVEDMGCVMSPSAKVFVSDFRRALKRSLAGTDIEIVSIKSGHYDFSGFVKKGDKYIYLSFSIPRHGMIIAFSQRILYRAAKNAQDFRGGNNHFCSLGDIGEELKRALP